MTTRRNFIKTSAFASAALLVNKANAKEEIKHIDAKIVTSKPIVLSRIPIGLVVLSGFILCFFYD